MSERGLSLTSEEQPSEDVPAGQVISQDPEPGTSLYAGERISVVFSTGPEEVSDVSFSRQILLPYEEKQAETSEEEPAENEEETEEEQNQEEEPEQEPEPELLPNEIQIYIDDLEKDMDNVAEELSITEDTRFVLNFVVEEGESATYRIVRDGETIIEETVSP